MTVKPSYHEDDKGGVLDAPGGGAASVNRLTLIRMRSRRGWWWWCNKINVCTLMMVNTTMIMMVMMGPPAPPAEYLVFKRGGGGGLPSTTNQPQTDPQHLKIWQNHFKNIEKCILKTKSSKNKTNRSGLKNWRQIDEINGRWVHGREGNYVHRISPEVKYWPVPKKYSKEILAIPSEY